MNCQEFRKLISVFIDDTMPLEERESFVHHSKRCNECMEDLEIHYMIRHTLMQVDDSKSEYVEEEHFEEPRFESLDMTAALQKQLSFYEHEAEKRYRRSLYQKFIFISSQSCAAILIILRLISLFR